MNGDANAKREVLLLQVEFGGKKMVTYEHADEKKSWGIRCTEDAHGKLWIGKSGSVPFEAVFPDLIQPVKKTLEETRGDRTGAFWINPMEKRLTIVTEDSTQSGEYPQADF